MPLPIIGAMAGKMAAGAVVSKVKALGPKGVGLIAVSILLGLALIALLIQNMWTIPRLKAKVADRERQILEQNVAIDTLEGENAQFAALTEKTNKTIEQMRKFGNLQRSRIRELERYATQQQTKMNRRVDRIMNAPIGEGDRCEIAQEELREWLSQRHSLQDVAAPEQ